MNKRKKCNMIYQIYEAKMDGLKKGMEDKMNGLEAKIDGMESNI